MPSTKHILNLKFRIRFRSKSGHSNASVFTNLRVADLTGNGPFRQICSFQLMDVFNKFAVDAFLVW
ncbi:hypothetical protein SAMN05192561_10583 [Halopenitus malekzadehii]|uniref:Uncharacterized protein n=1 Tax=Halopenitus malekzadehii TaxID=1267564 RepID=A0A1H6IVK4_9EURY|nr:hypothetical protein SAMN05192561_10583 [Halopenitus malekzadehii]